jgi:hypothetical protein
MAVVRPKRVKDWPVDQSKHEHLPAVPFRMIVAGPSGVGKTQLLQSIILDFYRTKGGKSVFARVYVFSPSVHADPVWGPVRRFCERELGQDDKKEKFLFDHYDPAELREVIETQKRVVAAGKQQEDLKKLWSILILVDDYADDVAFVRQSAMLHALFTRGRHAKISSIVSTQKYKALANIIRVNASALIVFRCRSMLELQAIIEENSAVLGKDGLMRLYHEATEEPYSFLYIDPCARTTKDMFWLRFERRLL